MVNVPIPGDPHQLLLTALVTIGMQLSFFAVAATFKFDKVTDFAGGTNFLVLALLTLFSASIYTWRQVLVTVLVCAWSVRLAGYLLYRILMIGKDDRFDETRDNFCKFLGFWVYQMVWVWTVMLPVTFLNTTEANPSFTAADGFGIAMFVIGLAIEAVADQQKFNFKQESSNRGRWCDAGLWLYSRHPNYFGEILLWWGVFTIASSVFKPADDAGDGGWGYATLLGPIYLTFILLFVSGIPVLEKSADERYGGRDEYRAYKSRTPVLLLCPPGLFGALPQFFKAAFCLEWPIYTSGEERKRDRDDAGSGDNAAREGGGGGVNAGSEAARAGGRPQQENGGGAGALLV